MSIKVVDLQNEEVKEEQPVIEEAKEEVDGAVVNEVDEEETIKEEKQEQEEEVKEANAEVKEVVKPIREQDAKRCVETQHKMVRCPKCQKEMKLKSFRYGHEKNCKGTLEQKPVKPHAKPKAKQQAKPPPEVYYSDSEEEEAPQKPFIKKKQTVQPIKLSQYPPFTIFSGTCFGDVPCAKLAVCKRL